MMKEEAIKAMSEDIGILDLMKSNGLYIGWLTLHYSGWIDGSHIGVKDGNQFNL